MNGFVQTYMNLQRYFFCFFKLLLVVFVVERRGQERAGGGVVERLRRRVERLEEETEASDISASSETRALERSRRVEGSASDAREDVTDTSSANISTSESRGEGTESGERGTERAWMNRKACCPIGLRPCAAGLQLRETWLKGHSNEEIFSASSSFATSPNPFLTVVGTNSSWWLPPSP